MSRADSLCSPCFSRKWTPYNLRASSAKSSRAPERFSRIAQFSRRASRDRQVIRRVLCPVAAHVTLLVFLSNRPPNSSLENNRPLFDLSFLAFRQLVNSGRIERNVASGQSQLALERH